MLKLFFMLSIYYPLSVGLTFYQKWFIKDYRFPLLIVAGHYLIKFGIAKLVCSTLDYFRGRKRMELPLKEQLRWLMPIGICASLDIGLSNWALEYVTISLYTMAKSSSILFIVGFSLLLRLERWRPSLGINAALIAAGLFLFTWRSTQLDLRGLFLIELAALCTGVRWTISQLIMQGSSGGTDQHSAAVRHPLDMIIAVQPWMFVAIVPMIAVIEGFNMTVPVLTTYRGCFQPLLILILILIGGLLAFLMEMAEYLLLVNTSGITLSLLGIVKEVITLLLAHQVHGDSLTPVNIVGLCMCISGMATHSLSKDTHRKTSALSLKMVSSPSVCTSPQLSAAAVATSSAAFWRQTSESDALDTNDRARLLSRSDEQLL